MNMLNRLRPYGPVTLRRFNRHHVRAWLYGFGDGWSQPYDLNTSTNVDDLDKADGDMGLVFESLDRGINAGQWARSPLNHQNYDRPWRRGRGLPLVIAAALLGGLLGFWLAPSRGSQSADFLPNGPLFTVENTSTEPYGGCDESWQAPDSLGGYDCGWRKATRQQANRLRHYFDQFGIHEQWRECYVNVDGTTLINCPRTGGMYES